jgi:hypothetical protein
VDALAKRFKGKDSGGLSAREIEMRRKMAELEAAEGKPAAAPAAAPAPAAKPQLGGMNLDAISKREKAAGLAEGGPVEEKPVAPMAGAAAKVSPKDPVATNPYYTMTGQSGDAFKYLMGQGTLSRPQQQGAGGAGAGVGAPGSFGNTGEFGYGGTGLMSRATAQALVNGGMGGGGYGANSSGTAGNYSYDPATGQYTFHAAPPPPPVVVDNSRSWTDFYSGGPGGGDGSAGSSSSDGGADGSSGAYAGGGLAQLAAGGRFLQGPGDGVSDSIPANIDGQQPAALATEEYVVPARVVSEIGNGSSSAGAKRLDQMVARVQQRAAKATKGRSSVAKDTRAYKELPA